MKRKTCLPSILTVFFIIVICIYTNSRMDFYNGPFGVFFNGPLMDH